MAHFVYQLASICLQLSPISITTGVLSRHLASLYMHSLFFLVRARLCNHNTHTLTGFDSLFHHFSYVGFHTVQWISLMICIQTGRTGLSTCIQITGFFPLGVRLASIQKKKKEKSRPQFAVIGASLSGPHTSMTALQVACACLLAAIYRKL